MSLQRISRDASDVDERDRAAWRDITSGMRPPTWTDLVGDPKAATYLSDTGREAAERVASGLERFFGPDWVGRAMDLRATDGVPIPAMVNLSPVLSLYGPEGAFIDLLRWWASIEVLEAGSVDGLSVLRRDVRRDVRPDRLFHALCQLRLGAIGTYLGWEVVLESREPGLRGDVLLRGEPAEVLIEVVTIGGDAAGRQEVQAMDEQIAFLRDLERQHEITWSGVLPGQRPKHELDAWKRRVGALAAEAAASGTPGHLGEAPGPVLTARPGRSIADAGLSGPVVEADQGTRILSKLGEKATQTRNAKSAWIWIEDRGALHPLTPFWAESPERKIGSMQGLLSSDLAERTHVAGVVFSSVARTSAATEDATTTIEAPGGLLLHRGVHPGRLRESIVVPRHSGTAELAMVVRLCADEPGWLDWALKQLGIHGGVSSLFDRFPT